MSNLRIFKGLSFISTPYAIKLHDSIIEKEGGVLGVLNLGLLESALNAPQQTFFGIFLNNSIFHMAASLLVGISKNHAFRDGNKRTAVMVTVVFLRVNGYEITVQQSAMTQLVLDVVENRITKEKVADYLQTHTRPLDIP